MYSHPVELIATLAYGLRDDSRIKMEISGMKIKPEILIMAKIADNTALNVYAKTEDAKHRRNYPKSLVEALTKEKKKSETPKEFNTGEDFMKEWNRLVNG